MQNKASEGRLRTKKHAQNQNEEANPHLLQLCDKGYNGQRIKKQLFISTDFTLINNYIYIHTHLPL